MLLLYFQLRSVPCRGLHTHIAYSLRASFPYKWFWDVQCLDLHLSTELIIHIQRLNYISHAYVCLAFALVVRDFVAYDCNFDNINGYILASDWWRPMRFDAWSSAQIAVNFLNNAFIKYAIIFYLQPHKVTQPHQHHDCGGRTYLQTGTLFISHVNVINGK